MTPWEVRRHVAKWMWFRLAQTKSLFIIVLDDFLENRLKDSVPRISCVDVSRGAGTLTTVRRARGLGGAAPSVSIALQKRCRALDRGSLKCNVSLVFK